MAGHAGFRAGGGGESGCEDQVNCLKAILGFIDVIIIIIKYAGLAEEFTSLSSSQRGIPCDWRHTRVLDEQLGVAPGQGHPQALWAAGGARQTGVHPWHQVRVVRSFECEAAFIFPACLLKMIPPSALRRGTHPFVKDDEEEDKKEEGVEEVGEEERSASSSSSSSKAAAALQARSLVQRVFGGDLASCVKCMQCGTTSDKVAYVRVYLCMCAWN